jgi:intein/homing endonuclease
LCFSGKNKLNCGNKFIPDTLLKSTPEFRFELLAGLIDTDGTLDKNTSFVFTSKSYILANDVLKLGISLDLDAVSHQN